MMEVFGYEEIWDKEMMEVFGCQQIHGERDDGNILVVNRYMMEMFGCQQIYDGNVWLSTDTWRNSCGWGSCQETASPSCSGRQPLYCKSVGRPTHFVLRYPVWSHCCRCKIITAGILYTLRVDCPTHCCTQWGVAGVQKSLRFPQLTAPRSTPPSCSHGQEYTLDCQQAPFLLWTTAVQ